MRLIPNPTLERSIMRDEELKALAERAIRDPHAFLSNFNMNRVGIERLVLLAKGTLELLEAKDE